MEYVSLIFFTAIYFVIGLGKNAVFKQGLAYMDSSYSALIFVTLLFLDLITFSSYVKFDKNYKKVALTN